VVHHSAHYTPPRNVRMMMNDLALLPAWYADEGDCVFIDRPESPHLSTWLPEGIRPLATPLTRKEMAALLPHAEAAPWGLSPQSILLFNELKRKYGLNIEIPLWQDDYAALAGRRTAACCLAEIQKLMPCLTFPSPPVFFLQTEEIEAYLQQHPGSFVLKTPYSSSGRGLLWLHENRLTDSDKNRIKGILRKQGSVSLEPALNRVLDFALEFYSDGKGNLRYEGLSVFSTNNRGAYQGNKLRPQSALWDKLLAYTSKNTLSCLQQAVTQTLTNTFGTRYTGYLGVDMLVYKDKDTFRIHPCVEINLRYTMGMAAIRLFENYLDEEADGIFNIRYETDSRQAYEQHLLMQKTYPLALKNGKLQQGYLSLCPVTEDTHYIAYILLT
jgi:hypothetical protein